MSDCDDIIEELNIFLDGEITPEKKASIIRHLDGCLNCLHVFDFHAELRLVIAAKCRDEVPPGLLERVEACFGTEDQATFEANSE
jgi:anti-sigma factor (TIGR02949 family)